MEDSKKLPYFSTTTSEQQKEIASKAGQISAKVQRERKNFKKLTQIMLDKPIPSMYKDLVEKLFPNMDADEMTAAFGILVKQYEKALMEGDTKAAEFLRDTAGERPENKNPFGPNINMFFAIGDLSQEDKENYLKEIECLE